MTTMQERATKVSKTKVIENVMRDAFFDIKKFDGMAEKLSKAGIRVTVVRRKKA